MSRRTIQSLTVFSALLIIGVVITQIYWVKQALDLRHREFNQNAHVALQDVATKLAKVNGVMQSVNPVEQLSPQYFLVNTNATTQPELLENFIKDSFQKNNLITDFEVGIYDCTTNRMRYGMSLSTKNNDKIPTPTSNWIKTDKYPYYFGVRFPEQDSYFAGTINGAIWSSVLVLVAVSFFAYALFVILRQKQLSEVQRDFVNNMTHELQTPISTIRIAADVLNSDNIVNQPKRHQRYVQIVQDEILRLQGQVEMVLSMAKAERNALTLQKEVMRAEDIIESVLLPFENKITFLNKAENTLIEADPFHFRCMINNLIDNALKYSNDTPDVRIETYNKGKCLFIAVQDHGIGIAPEYRKKIFNQFFRVPYGDVHNAKGFGIGLSYVKQIVRSHNWKLDLESELGKGSTFKISIPQK
ncbi:MULTISPECIES: sensor histidine kinase KdpD [Dyadobacter]|jgi:two-component system phosphate regulon sensor histidine kinase PhoR|uniref:histidine kinase n=1 Tax=Dyadobacter chenhuakuii TaxID=2909339 RepID=A0ABY4XID1_9BACT|nr:MULTISPECIES: HAMP domain-containing sensor histidine kinase [Dyadobacter]MCE7073479.1 HAMP domain-containing histidine kinase [Dyadobacter sp. CY327]MCF2495969.1 HAMP domain-containing histidine kinase [Dyadobacter chenhuakuii]MCF2519920.1 HAMP domain-containing histidine kinase [Dyadobacter sp. CY351]USJ30039.1 HAMP domain-containing histidine kinase [Dyadobacter chenhuakuii]